MKTTIAMLTVLATLISAAPAFACGPYLNDEMEVRAAVHERLGARSDVRFDELVVDDDQADVLVSWMGSSGRVEQSYVLAFRDGAWRVTRMSYHVRAGTFQRIAAAHRR